LPAANTTYHSLLYRHFKEIAADNFRQIIRFCEDNEHKIRYLEFEEYFDFRVAYVNALFEIGAYKKHLLFVDAVIEMVISHNIQVYNGQDIYRDMLFRKAASLYNLYDFDKCVYILRQLIRIDPEDKYAVQLLTVCLRRQSTFLLRLSRALAILLFLVTAVIIFIEVMAVRPFFDRYTTDIELLRNLGFVSGLLVLGLGFLYHRLQADYHVSHFVACVKSEKGC
jgi:tetratricopeptide (TPR) repeat protein